MKNKLHMIILSEDNVVVNEKEFDKLKTDLDDTKKKAKADYNFIYDKLILLNKGYKKIKADLDEKQKIIDEIAGLCSNCRNLSDAMEIAAGSKSDFVASVDGCQKCWVDKLESDNKDMKDILKEVILACSDRFASIKQRYLVIRIKALIGNK